MPTIEALTKELEDLGTLKLISNALLEVSAIKIRTLRFDFERNQEFYSEMSELYSIVKSSAIKVGSSSDKKKSDSVITIAITSNQRFHGSLNKIVMDEFVKKTDEDGGGSYLVVGHTGKEYLSGIDKNLNVEYLVFKDDYPTVKETEMFLNKVKEYGKVVLYYPKFTNVFIQENEIVDITHTPDIAKEGALSEGDLENIFEPELSKILEFFETQIKKLLFMHIMLESELSRTAARLVKMNSTESRATHSIAEKKALLRKENMVINDIRLLETFSSILQWKKM